MIIDFGEGEWGEWEQIILFNDRREKINDIMVIPMGQLTSCCGFRIVSCDEGLCGAVFGCSGSVQWWWSLTWNGQNAGSGKEERRKKRRREEIEIKDGNEKSPDN